MNQNDQMRKLEPCPFCGSTPELSDGIGTQYEIECTDCCQSIVGIQICDLMTIEERKTETFENFCYAPKYVERAKQEAIKRWNTRAHVNETPKNEHDSDDVLKPAKLVRLTEMELWRNDELMALNAEFGLLFPDVQRFANAIMDAFLQKNGLDK